MRRRPRGRWLVGRPDPRAFAPLNSGAPYSYRLLLQIYVNPTGAAMSTQEPPIRDKLSPFTPPGHRLATPRHLVPTADARTRAASGAGQNPHAAPCAAQLSARPQPIIGRGRTSRSRIHAQTPGGQWLSLRIAGDGTWRVRGARQSARPLPDGQRSALPHRPVR